MATISLSTNLDVQDKYKGLVEQSLAEGSVYIRTKETLMDMFDKGYVKDDQIAEVLSNVLASANQTVFNTSMSTALQWAEAEKNLVLKKAELEAQLDTIAEDTALKTAQVTKLGHEDVAVQANTRRTYGVPTVVNGEVTTLTDVGSAYNETELIKEKIISEQKNQDIATAKVDEAYAGVNKIVADTFANYGMLNGYTVDKQGLSGLSTIGHHPLSELQATIAEEQAKGYAYNAWANAASGLGSTIGVAMTSDTNIFGNVAGQYTGLLTDWKDTVAKLKNITQPTFN